MASKTLFDIWIEEQIGRIVRQNPPFLILCRTDATAASVRAWAARRGGVAGLDVATPRSLAHQLEGPWLTPQPVPGDLPHTPFTEKLINRPGLANLARQHVRALRLARAADPQLQGPSYLRELADSPWAMHEQLEVQLLMLARAGGSKLTDSLQWEKVIPIGFDAPLDPWTTALLKALKPRRRRVVVKPTDPGQTLRVLDPASEARLACSFAQADPSNTLVLVQHDATAARIHRALRRSGIPCAWRPAARLARHTLASIIRRCVHWFSNGDDPLLRAVDIYEVLRHPMLGSRLPPPAQVWLTGRLEELDAVHGLALSPRGLAATLRRARHLHAPLSRWQKTLATLSMRRDTGSLAANAARLYARLGVLEACVRGIPLLDIFPGEGPEEDADWGEFDALVAALAGDLNPDLPPEIAPAGTLGALRRFLLSSRVRTRDDPAGWKILGALRRGADRPATRLEALQLLTGSTDRGEVRTGVEILSYDDYDRRPCRQLILTDVHDQGVAARPRPDSLLTDIELTELGLLDGRSQVESRLHQLRCAVTQSEHAVAIVTTHDIMGRALIPPVQLSLTPTPADLAPYGVNAELPELAPLACLDVVPAGAPPPACADPLLQHHVVQTSAEWVRHGRGPVAGPAAVNRAPGAQTLAHLLVQRPQPPRWLRPYLGDATDTPEAYLDAPENRNNQAEKSASGFFLPLTHCLYQTFARVQLGIREQERVSEDLDPREIGTAAHRALEGVVHRGGFAYSDGEQSAVREDFLRSLQHHNHLAFQEAIERFGELSPARAAATDGLRDRWSRHWELYALKRVRPGIEGQPSLSIADDLLFQHHFLDSAAAALAESARLAAVPIECSESTLRGWLKAASKEVFRGHRPATKTDHGLTHLTDRIKLPTAWAPTLRQFLQHPRFIRLVHLWELAERLTAAIHAPIIASVAELPFGASDHTAQFGAAGHTEPVAIGPVQLQLGEETVAVRGSIDRVDVVRERSGPLVRIVDYKSSKSAPSERYGRRRLYSLIDPQLVIYALVVQRAIETADLPSPLKQAEIATIGWDHIRATDTHGQIKPPLDAYLMDRHTLHLLSRALGKLVHHARQGRWDLSPHPDTCPVLRAYQHDHCPYASACRLRGLASEIK